MKTVDVELVCILDRSGSMSGLEEDTIGGYNHFVSDQTKSHSVMVTTVLFDDKYEVLFDQADAKEATLSNRQYFVRGSTALLDAIGKTINLVKDRVEAGKGDKAETVIFVITTDGMENASREFTYAGIHSLIKSTEQHYGWKFLFLAANIDEKKEAAKMGIRLDRAVKYESTKEGTEAMYKNATCMVESMIIDDKKNKN